jgi:hypothetical protein
MEIILKSGDSHWRTPFATDLTYTQRSLIMKINHFLALALIALLVVGAMP